ncbi:MAG: hypothetical protein WAW17_04720 [Rhodococcus sp. (in: high G+C Gram-positive bacteria)]|uniref:hypothetical protein n=1 Tax=Rhodococcus sp. TaxID=1831 RepID=UPI003BB1388B
MDDNNAMLSFAVKWRHWGGGPDEDIFIEFGIPPHQFFHRLRRLLTNCGSQLPPHVVEQLIEICDDRIQIPTARVA